MCIFYFDYDIFIILHLFMFLLLRDNHKVLYLSVIFVILYYIHY